MSTGPIEFLSEGGAAHTVPDTEFGGASGLIQPARGDGAFRGAPEAKGGHDLEKGDDSGVVRDVAGIARRAAMRPLSMAEQMTGLPDVPGEVRDPVTGRLAPDSKNKAGGEGSGELSGLKP